ncbi:aldehyde-activating protein [Caulobacter sp. Root655]|uniref:GFA family protein n=1 Tax=Caulobacter sp. Root655 TaxID=1736578 RepID=UPI0006FCBBBA|nr:GFA family protein [Caulobacter sp. Root655]KRA56347.1 aldehyde-activating protein [Caulobacter sp. Root655]
MATEPAQLRGECFCRAVAYTVPDAFEYALNCHCSGCRRATGSAFKPFAGIAAGQLSVVRGQDRMMRYGDEAGHDAHCGVCGSLLYSLVRDGAYVHVTLGTLNDTPSIRPAAHIFVGSKAPWHTLCDGLPQFAELPPD